jgi:DNA-binding GntR family transcriptional regulator
MIASEIAAGNSADAADIVTEHLEHARAALLKNLESQKN